MIDLDRLNAHSRMFADQLFRLWPEWLRFARYDPYEDFEKEALLVEVPCPADGSTNGLFITTSEWEISIGFGESFHARFGSAGEPVQSDFMAEALAFLQDFLKEDLVIATASENGEWLGSWKVDLRTQGLESLEVESGVEVRVRSWLGTYDSNRIS